MKKAILPIVLLAISMISSAQQKYFDEAIRRGTTPNGFYCATNPNGKCVTAEEMTKYAKSKKYIIGRVATAQTYRYGAEFEVFYKFEFMVNDKNFENYVFYFIDGNNAKNKPQLNKGRVYLGYKGLGDTFKQDRDTTFLATHENVKWTGKVVNGLIEGTGKGLIRHNETYTFFQGTFKDGLPISEIKAKGYNLNGKTKGRLSNDYIHHFDIDKEHVGALAKNATKIPACKKHLEIYYKKELPKMNNAYQKALKTTKSNHNQFNISFDPERFYNNYQSVATSEEKKKCKQLTDFYCVIEGLRTKPRKYYEDGLFGVSYFNKLYEEDWTKVDKAEEVSKKTSTPFSAFFASVKNDFAPLKKRIKDKAQSDYNEYVIAWNREKERKRNSSSSYSSSSSSSSSHEKTTTSKPVNSSVNPETVSIPSYEFDSKWYIGFHDYYNVKNEVGENQYRDLKFSDGTKGKVCRVAQGGNKFWYWSDNARYETLEDAIKAVYVKEKYGKTRDKGRIHGVFY